jgi:hypothetical protein
MYQIDGARPRLIAQHQLTAADFYRIAAEIGALPFSARKIGFIAARKALKAERIETRWNAMESQDVAAVGDYVVTNLLRDRLPLRDGEGNLNSYVIRADRFIELYEPVEGTSLLGPIHQARGKVEAFLIVGGFEILAPWGETQRADAGYLILNGTEVYGNAQETFEATYDRV